jgi:hypothetical protein
VTFPKEIYSGADGYSMMRLASYDLSVDQWKNWHAECEFNEIALSARPDGTSVWTSAVVSSAGEVSFNACGSTWLKYRQFATAHEAMAYHEELAKDIVDRIALMKSHAESALSGGVL